MTCRCQSCGMDYKVDVMVPDEIWDKIRPSNKEGEGGLLCGRCIMFRIESMSDYSVFHLIDVSGDDGDADD